MREYRTKQELRNKVKKISLFFILMGVIGFVTSGCNGSSDDNISTADLKPAAQSAQESVFDAKAASVMTDESDAAADANANTNAVVDLDETNLSTDVDKMARMTIEDYGRPNPFLPPSEAIDTTRTVSELPFELVNPPEDPTVDSDASRIIKTKVSGILYDDHNPAAILNMEGTDYLVRTGDVINNYKVLAIYKNDVAVQLGDNIYKAGVGELLATNKIHHNTVPNLDKRFGGSDVKMSIEN